MRGLVFLYDYTRVLEGSHCRIGGISRNRRALQECRAPSGWVYSGTPAILLVVTKASILQCYVALVVAWRHSNLRRT